MMIVLIIVYHTKLIFTRKIITIKCYCYIITVVFNFNETAVKLMKHNKKNNNMRKVIAIYIYWAVIILCDLIVGKIKKKMS